MKSTKTKTKTHPHDDAIDSLKGVLIIMVVFGHLIFPFIQYSFLKTIYVFLFAVHIPLFSFLSGYLYRLRPLDEQTKRLFIPYLFFQILYVCASLLFFNMKLTLTGIITPFGQLWYIWALFFWGYMSELLKHFRGAVFIALVVGVLIQVIEHASLFELTRILTFFPFFLAGIYLQKKSLRNVHTIISLPLAYLVLSGVMLVLFMTQQRLDDRWFLRLDSYTELRVSNVQGILISFFLYFVSSIACLVVTRLALFPNRFLVRVGKMSMYIYLWHYLFVLFLYNFIYPSVSTNIGLCIALLSTGILTVFLSHPQIKRSTDNVLSLFQQLVLNTTLV